MSNNPPPHPPPPHPECLGSDIHYAWQLHLLFSRFICVMLINSCYLKLSLGFGKQFIGNNDRCHAFGINLHRRAPRYWQDHLDKCCKMIFNIYSNNQLTDSPLTGLLIPLAANQPANQAHPDRHWSALAICWGQSLVNKEGMPEQISETSLIRKWSITSSYQHHEGGISLYKAILLWWSFILI